MHLIEVQNVSQALIEGCRMMDLRGQERDSRNGKVKVLPDPLATVYSRPTDRVLFYPERDANPFFHFFEALWMLAGRNDVEFPRQFNSKFGEFSDDGVVFNGAYGHRWRKHFGGDQLTVIAMNLSANPDCRRQVLSMWDPSRDLGSSSKDVPCNLTVTFQVGTKGTDEDFAPLNMVVFNRSNDLIWGAYGANAVHFGYLLEYMAAATGRPVGSYTQVSANTHVYERHWELVKELASRAPMPPEHDYGDRYSDGRTSSFPLVNLPIGRWNRELDTFMRLQHRSEYVDPFFQHVAKPMYMAWVSFSERTNVARFNHARRCLNGVLAPDWQRAAWEWIERRELAAAAKRESA